MRWRIAVALGAVIALVAVAVGYARFAADRAPAATAAPGTVSLTSAGMLVRSTDGGRWTLVTADGKRVATPLTCARAYAAHGTGVCLRSAAAGIDSYEMAVISPGLQTVRTIPLNGVPNRARVSASGRMISWTVFAAGDSYNGGRFSTRSGILDTRTNALAGTLETFAVTREGKAYQAADLNFWGVTFTADDNRFYATMGTDGHRYLVEGDFAARTVRTVRDGVECPSLSPDGKRIAFKKPVSGGDPDRPWRLTVLDLASMVETPLAETRGVDDQPAWLDNATVGYALPRGVGHADVWAVPGDGSGVPVLRAADAESPSEG